MWSDVTQQVECKCVCVCVCIASDDSQSLPASPPLLPPGILFSACSDTHTHTHTTVAWDPCVSWVILMLLVCLLWATTVAFCPHLIYIYVFLSPKQPQSQPKCQICYHFSFVRVCVGFLQHFLYVFFRYKTPLSYDNFIFVSKKKEFSPSFWLRHTVVFKFFCNFFVAVRFFLSVSLSILPCLLHCCRSFFPWSQLQ